jgi:hypothetical protein
MSFSGTFKISAVVPLLAPRIPDIKDWKDPTRQCEHGDHSRTGHVIKYSHKLYPQFQNKGDM